MCPARRLHIRALAIRISGLCPSALEALGYGIAIFPGGTVRALAQALADYFDNLKTRGTTAPYRDRMLDFKGINDGWGTNDMLNEGRRYE
jgi:2-methylisocitrate lyase-like PEP mutase family enzyme